MQSKYFMSYNDQFHTIISTKKILFQMDTLKIYFTLFQSKLFKSNNVVCIEYQHPQNIGRRIQLICFFMSMKRQNTEDGCGEQGMTQCPMYDPFAEIHSTERT